MSNRDRSRRPPAASHHSPRPPRQVRVPITSPATIRGSNQSLESRLTRVRNLYQAVLGRNPDPTGWPFWAEVILAKGDIELAVSLAGSREYFMRSWDRYL